MIIICEFHSVQKPASKFCHTLSSFRTHESCSRNARHQKKIRNTLAFVYFLREYSQFIIALLYYGGFIYIVHYIFRNENEADSRQHTTTATAIRIFTYVIYAIVATQHARNKHAQLCTRTTPVMHNTLLSILGYPCSTATTRARAHAQSRARGHTRSPIEQTGEARCGVA